MAGHGSIRVHDVPDTADRRHVDSEHVMRTGSGAAKAAMGKRTV